ncbi:MAG: DUF4358 domain-containing protein [Firmicutes bacterium]|nr:DUF4358 domain-containing protein [Bacillota bacterium]
MKLKKILLSLTMLFIFTGCGTEVELDLDKLETKLNNLTYVENKEEVKLFEDNIEVDDEKLEDKYGMNTEIFDEILISTSKNLDTASMYAIFLPEEGYIEECEQEINNFFEKYEQAWMMGYFPEEEKLVKNRSSEKYGNYYIYVISKDNDKVIETIKNTK